MIWITRYHDAVKPLEYQAEYRALEQSLNIDINHSFVNKLKSTTADSHTTQCQIL